MTTTSRAVVARLSAAIARWQQRLSRRVHAAGDAAAREHGWTITETRGRLGFSGRVYRDPRFATRGSGSAAGLPPADGRTSRAR